MRDSRNDRALAEMTRSMAGVIGHIQGPRRTIVEVQVRTYQMHVRAERGDAGHTRHKGIAGPTSAYSGRSWMIR